MAARRCCLSFGRGVPPLIRVPVVEEELHLFHERLHGLLLGHEFLPDELEARVGEPAARGCGIDGTPDAPGRGSGRGGDGLRGVRGSRLRRRRGSMRHFGVRRTRRRPASGFRRRRVLLVATLLLA